MQKDYCPGYYDLSSGGVVGADETDEDNAYRELNEELGISGVTLERITTVKYEDDNNRVWGNVFLLTYDGEIKL